MTVHPPALATFATDPRRTLVIIKTYEYLLTVLDFVTTTDVKAWLVADTIHSSRERVGEALTWLTECGYLTEHARGQHGVRRFTLRWSKAPDSQMSQTVTHTDAA